MGGKNKCVGKINVLFTVLWNICIFRYWAKTWKIILLWKLYWLFTSFGGRTNLYDQEKNETVLYIVNLPLSKGITNKENFQYQWWDLNKVIKSVIMMIMMKNIKKMDPRLKKETVNEIFKKENNKKKSETSN